MNRKKSIGLILPALTALLLLLAIPARVHAQHERADSTDVEELKDPPPPPQEYLDDSDRDQDPVITAEPRRYFLKKWQQADSLDMNSRVIPPEQIQKLKSDKDFWYASEDLKPEKPQPAEKPYGDYVPLGERTWFKTIMWIVIIGGFLFALVWFLNGSQVGIFRKKDRVVEHGEEPGDIPEDIFAINYRKEIDKAAAAGNFRLAVRLMYLHMLRNMAERNIIQYTQEKTNLDYLMQLQATAYYNGFFRLTRDYEYSWYGHFEINKEAWEKIKEEFDRFERSM